MKKILSVFKWIGISLATIIIVLLLTVTVIWWNELSSICSIKKLKAANPGGEDGAIYSMHIKGNYYFDDFIASGGVKSDAELLNFITNHITRGFVKMAIPETSINCSSYTANTKNGNRIFARNYDFIKTSTCIVFTDSGKNRYATISTVDLEFLGITNGREIVTIGDKITCLAVPFCPLDGINEKGLACGIYISYQNVPTNQNTSKPDITSTTLLRLILDTASTVDEAIKIAQSYDLHDSANTSFHYMIADRSGKSAILEWTYGTQLTDNDGSLRTLKVTYSSEADNNQLITNFIVQPGYYDGITDTNMIHGLERYNMMKYELNVRNGIVSDVIDGLSVLKRVGQRNIKTDPQNPWLTLYSIVYDLTDNTVYWVGNEHFEEDPFIYKF